MSEPIAALESAPATAKGRGILERYALVLDTLAGAPHGLTLTEIIARTGLPRGTAHRLIGALLDVGYAIPVDGRKVYVVGPRLLRMAFLGTPAQSVAAMAKPLLERLVDRFGETAFVAKLIGDHVESIAMETPDGSDRSYVRPGRAMPIHAAASAKAIFAFQDRDVVDRALRQPRIDYADKTRTDEAWLRDELARVRRDGFAICDEELDPGVFSYACPVFLDGAGVIHSVGLVAMTQRLRGHSENAVIQALRDTAADLARASGMTLSD